MITISILWALVIALFVINSEQPNERNYHARKSNAIIKVSWPLWFAVFSPFIAVLLAVLGAFILAR